LQGLVAVAFLVATASAQAQKITTGYDHDANLDNYQILSFWSEMSFKRADK
jgi:collagenase-like PrtC family protease